MRKCFLAWPRSQSAVSEILVRWWNFQLLWIYFFVGERLGLWQDLVEIIFLFSRSGPYLVFECNFRFLQMPYFERQVIDNLGLKCPASSCKQVPFAAGAQGKPMHCRAMVWVENLTFSQNIYQQDASSLQESMQQQQLWCYFIFKFNLEEGFLPAKIFWGLLTQRFSYCFKIYYCLWGFYMCKSLLFL